MAQNAVKPTLEEHLDYLEKVVQLICSFSIIIWKPIRRNHSVMFCADGSIFTARPR